MIGLTKLTTEFMYNSNALENQTMLTFIDWMHKKYIGKIKNEQTTNEIDNDTRRFCVILYKQWRINADFVEELHQFFKVKMEYK